MKLLLSNLYDQVLLQPARDGADALKIVSGFASPVMAYKHMSDIQEINFDINVELIYGMSKCNGVEIATHKGFIYIQEDRFKDRFSCHYSTSTKPVHAKVYTWLRNGKPILSYTGSANYTKNGLIEGMQQESLTQTDHKQALRFFESLKGRVVNCNNKPLIDENNIVLFKRDKKGTISRLPKVKLSLLRKNGLIHKKAGLNWGQREKRDRNEAYIPIPKDVASTDFFPTNTIVFKVLTDDGFIFKGTIAQQGRKALHSTESNAILGKYFRKRLGLKEGQFIEVCHLEKYGRTTVEFEKIDCETYFMDFS